MPISVPSGPPRWARLRVISSFGVLPNIEIPWVTSTSRPTTPSDASRSPPGAPKALPRRPKTPPKAAQGAPRTAQDGPKTAQDTPPGHARAAPDGPGPLRDPPGSLPGPPGTPHMTIFGTIFGSLSVGSRADLGLIHRPALLTNRGLQASFGVDFGRTSTQVSTNQPRIPPDARAVAELRYPCYRE